MTTYNVGSCYVTFQGTKIKITSISGNKGYYSSWDGVTWISAGLYILTDTAILQEIICPDIQTPTPAPTVTPTPIPTQTPAPTPAPVEMFDVSITGPQGTTIKVDGVIR